MKTVAVIQARMSSSRLPNKTLMMLGHKTVLQWVCDAAKAIHGVNEVVVATSTDESDMPIIDFCKTQNINVFRGSLEDVLDRFYNAAREYKPDLVMRLTADCPLLDSEVCSTILKIAKSGSYDYVSNVAPPTWPDGLDCEVMTFKSLETSQKEATKKYHREHVTQYILSHRTQFKVENVVCPIPSLTSERWTLDHQEDFEFLNEVAKNIDNNQFTSYLKVLQILDNKPEIRKINQSIVRNEGLATTKKQESNNKYTFKKSEQLLVRAEKTIPVGSQTFSKSKTQYPPGHAPLFATHGFGSHIWDVDGNEYIDFVNALLPNVLGYCDEDVNRAITSQLSKGVSLSLATELEYQLAEKLNSLIPCAEKVRFGKNGSDATTAAIRLARAYTSREKIIVCGYHGWHDWYIGTTTRNIGVPKAISDLSILVPYNDLNALSDILEKNKGQVAAMILEPMNFVEPATGYLEGLKKLLHSHGALLIFDEIITGFRYHLGGAQKYFGTTPDLASFGKSMANGMPISAVVGRSDVMKLMEDAFISGTFGGECLSLAASLATIEKMEKENVIDQLWSTGKSIRTSLQAQLDQYGLNDIIKVKGKDPWQLLQYTATESFTADEIKTFVLTHLWKAGILTVGSHNICYAHSAEDIRKTISIYDLIFNELAEGLQSKTLLQKISSPILKPLFKVR